MSNSIIYVSIQRLTNVPIYQETIKSSAVSVKKNDSNKYTSLIEAFKDSGPYTSLVK